MDETNQTHEFKEIVDTWYQAIYRFSYSLSKSEHTASDITQQTFYILAKNLDNIRDKSKVKSWLFTTAYREFIKYNKKAKRMTTTEDDTIFEMQSEETQVYKEARHKMLLKSIENMEEKYREPLKLFYLDDLTYKEISEKMGIPIGTVMSRISRSKEHLKHILRDISKEME